MRAGFSSPEEHIAEYLYEKERYLAEDIHFFTSEVVAPLQKAVRDLGATAAKSGNEFMDARLSLITVELPETEARNLVQAAIEAGDVRLASALGPLSNAMEFWQGEVNELRQQREQNLKTSTRHHKANKDWYVETALEEAEASAGMPMEGMISNVAKIDHLRE